MMALREDLGYPVVVAEDAVPSARRAIAARNVPFVVLCDENPHVVAVGNRLHGARAILPVALGERRKRLNTIERVLDALARAGLERGGLVVGVGGGVASDLFGLSASLYMRGVPYLHVATSLVAMADAAVGGKTGVDLGAGKNLAGTFSDPIGVFAHVQGLRTLPLRAVREGLAEIVKAAVLRGGEFFETIEELAPHRLAAWPWPLLIGYAVSVKCEIVARDRRERGERALLNLGHTFGHAFERASAYRITHGAGVALGLRAAGLLALELGRFSQRDHLRILTLLSLLKMPLRTSVEAEDALAAMQHDKKRRDGAMHFVLPDAIGRVRYGVKAPLRAVRSVLRLMRDVPGTRG
ncbi:MAG: 3-dehydroquinate synthase [Candidatus Tyrphobacter sp.]